MATLHAILDGDGCWPDLDDLKKAGLLVDGMESQDMEVALLRGGTVLGNPSVTFRVGLPGGKVAIFQTTLKLLSTAVRSLEAAAERN